MARSKISPRYAQFTYFYTINSIQYANHNHYSRNENCVGIEIVKATKRVERL